MNLFFIKRFKNILTFVYYGGMAIENNSEILYDSMDKILGWFEKKNI